MTPQLKISNSKHTYHSKIQLLESTEQIQKSFSTMTLLTVLQL